MNCQYCGSKLFESDRTCPQCGAPNIRQVEIKSINKWGYFVEMLESTSPKEFYKGKNFELPW